jgi:TetR/AcrR family transcriptional regulator, transcriptional repressor for nem operon
VEKSTLADIAAAADVPLGNVYYYFKTKDALVSAVIEDYRQTFGQMNAQLSQGEDPAGRLKALLGVLTTRQERLASYGCPVGSLTSELGKRDDDLRVGAGSILSGFIDWAETQFQDMGRDDARELATALIAAYEGIVLLAAALRDPGLIGIEVSRLSRWIDSLAELALFAPLAVRGTLLIFSNGPLVPPARPANPLGDGGRDRLTPSQRGQRTGLAPPSRLTAEPVT